MEGACQIAFTEAEAFLTNLAMSLIEACCCCRRIRAFYCIFLIFSVGKPDVGRMSSPGTPGTLVPVVE